MVPQGKGIEWPKGGGAVTHSLQVQGSPGRVVSARLEGPGELSDSPSPQPGTPKAGPVPS